MGLVPCPNGCDQMTGQCKQAQMQHPQQYQQTPNYQAPAEENFDDFFVE